MRGDEGGVREMGEGVGGGVCCAGELDLLRYDTRFSAFGTFSLTCGRESCRGDFPAAHALIDLSSFAVYFRSSSLAFDNRSLAHTTYTQYTQYTTGNCISFQGWSWEWSGVLWRHRHGGRTSTPRVRSFLDQRPALTGRRHDVERHARSRF